jgi:hypothetical protein
LRQFENAVNLTLILALDHGTNPELTRVSEETDQR